MNNLKIFETNVFDGPMALSRKFYYKDATENEIKKHMKNKLELIAKKYEFLPDRVIRPAQNGVYNTTHEDGKHILITNDLIKEYENLFFTLLPCDIFVMKDNVEDTVIGCGSADCPILIAYSKEEDITSVAHCGSAYINRYLPISLIDSLQKEKAILDNNIKVYISSCISKDSYIYDKYPNWATDEKVWNECITKKDNLYYIDLRKAILKQLLERNIDLNNIYFNELDTFTDNLLYSNRAWSLGVEDKKGQFLVGTFFKSRKK